MGIYKFRDSAGPPRVLQLNTRLEELSQGLVGADPLESECRSCANSAGCKNHISLFQVAKRAMPVAEPVQVEAQLSPKARDAIEAENRENVDSLEWGRLMFHTKSLAGRCPPTRQVPVPGGVVKVGCRCSYSSLYCCREPFVLRGK